MYVSVELKENLMLAGFILEKQKLWKAEQWFSTLLDVEQIFLYKI